jgi:hypothetical protein
LLSTRTEIKCSSRVNALESEISELIAADFISVSTAIPITESPPTTDTQDTSAKTEHRLDAYACMLLLAGRRQISSRLEPHDMGPPSCSRDSARTRRESGALRRTRSLAFGLKRSKHPIPRSARPGARGCGRLVHDLRSTTQAARGQRRTAGSGVSPRLLIYLKAAAAVR